MSQLKYLELSVLLSAIPSFLVTYFIDFNVMECSDLLIINFNLPVHLIYYTILRESFFLTFLYFNLFNNFLDHLL